ncbi:MAG: T9SS type A sorting domain-containing protein [Bacteriovoracaceae bacterium]
MRSFLNQVFIVIAVVADCVVAQSSALPLYTAPQNFRIYPSGVTQTEVFVTRHPTSADILFSSANTINLSSGFISEGVYVSTDGGISWKGNDTCTGAPLLFHKGDPGITIDKSGKFILTRLGFQDGLFSHVSTDLGKTWSSQRTIGIERQDRASVTSDVNPASLYYGRTYTAYVELLPPFPLKVSFTNDGGTTWTSPLSINSPTQRCQGAELALGPESSVYAVWSGVISQSPFTEDFIGFARSFDGGATWNVVENIIDINGIQGVLAQKASIRVNGLPRIDVDRTTGVRRGWIYIVTAQKNLAPSGTDPDIIFYRSTDGGTSWGSGKRINNDVKNNGKIQYFPAIHVDDDGGINVLYYDDRNTSSDSAGVYLSRSTDGGGTWQDFPVSDHHFRPKSIGGLGQGYQGDNIAVTGVSGSLVPLWMDNSSGLYQLWSARIPLSSLLSVNRTMHIPQEFWCEQNYPNPFNPTTTIVFSLPTRCSVTVSVFDVMGREMATLFNGEKTEGEHRIEFSLPDRMASGVYFLQLSAGKYHFTGKMVFQK